MLTTISLLIAALGLLIMLLIGAVASKLLRAFMYWDSQNSQSFYARSGAEMGRMLSRIRIPFAIRHPLVWITEVVYGWDRWLR